MTGVSGTFVWPVRNKPVVHRFELDGRGKTHTFAITQSRMGWKIDVKLKDWAEIAVIEARE